MRMVGTRLGHAQLLLRFPRKLCAYLGAKFGMVRRDQPHRCGWRNGMWGGNKTSSTLPDFCVNLYTPPGLGINFVGSFF